MVDQLVTFLTGLIFGIGLLLAGMVRRSNILGFLGLGADWNPSLLFVLGCGVLVNLITFNYMLKVKYIWIYIENIHIWVIACSILLAAKSIGS